MPNSKIKTETRRNKRILSQLKNCSVYFNVCVVFALYLFSSWYCGLIFFSFRRRINTEKQHLLILHSNNLRLIARGSIVQASEMSQIQLSVLPFTSCITSNILINFQASIFTVRSGYNMYRASRTEWVFNKQFPIISVFNKFLGQAGLGLTRYYLDVCFLILQPPENMNAQLFAYSFPGLDAPGCQTLTLKK